MQTPLRLTILLLGFLGSCTSDSDAGRGDPHRSDTASVAAQPAAPPAPTAGRTVFDFDREKPGALPVGWKAEGTQQHGPVATWSVSADGTAPSKPNVLALTNAQQGSDDTFNLCWTDRVRFQDGRVELALKAVSGEVDQGGGPIWRVQDKNNYYICRANPLESNLRVYYVKDGARKQLATASIEIPSGTWMTIAIEHRGSRIVCFLNGAKLLEATDEHLPAAGGVGVWTKADSLAHFDDLVVTDG